MVSGIEHLHKLILSTEIELRALLIHPIQTSHLSRLPYILRTVQIDRLMWITRAIVGDLNCWKRVSKFRNLWAKFTSLLSLLNDPMCVPTYKSKLPSNCVSQRLAVVVSIVDN